ncbi:MAG: imidazolonepropionase [Anaerolineales bacterium]|nr:imidazolonepropionase [Anaerolineales bacterium]
MKIKIDLLITHASQIATCAADSPKRHAAMRELGLIEDGAIAITDGKITAIGSTADLTAHYTADKVIDASGRAIVPGLIDPHTHVVYAGDRAHEFELRIQGATYMEIMAAGGGIVSTTRAVRAASVDQLVAESRPRLDEMLRLGTTTIEIKSGYGLNTEAELNMLQAAAELDQIHPLDIVPTFLGAHAVPPEFKGDTEGYTQHVINEQLPAAAEWFANSHFPTQNIPFFNDVFCEQNAFDLAQSRRVLEAGLAYNMTPKIHADEFNSLGSVTMAVELGAISADHLDVTGMTEIERVAASATIAVPLPAVNFNLGSTHFANARAMLDAGAAVALATDINPGSAPTLSMQFIMAIACRYQRLLPSEALNASTINAAHAIGLGDRVGSLEVGKQADLLILTTADYRHLAYQFGGNVVQTVVKNGRIVV